MVLFMAILAAVYPALKSIEFETRRGNKKKYRDECKFRQNNLTKGL